MIRCSAIHKETIKLKAQIEKEFSLVAHVSIFFSVHDEHWFLMEFSLFLKEHLLMLFLRDRV